MASPPEEKITFPCQECGKLIVFPADSAGRVETCPECGRYVDVPDKSGVPPAEPDAVPPKDLAPVERTTLELWFEVSAVLCLAYLPALYHALGRSQLGQAGGVLSFPQGTLQDNIGGANCDAPFRDHRIGEGRLVVVRDCSSAVGGRPRACLRHLVLLQGVPAIRCIGNAIVYLEIATPSPKRIACGSPRGFRLLLALCCLYRKRPSTGVDLPRIPHTEIRASPAARHGSLCSWRSSSFIRHVPPLRRSRRDDRYHRTGIIYGIAFCLTRRLAHLRGARHAQLPALAVIHTLKRISRMSSSSPTESFRRRFTRQRDIGSQAAERSFRSRVEYLAATL